MGEIMYPEKFRIFATNIIQMLPRAIRNLIFKIIIELRFILFLIKLKSFNRTCATPSPTKIYWISPQRIIYHTNYLKNKDSEKLSFAARVFPLNMRGKVVGGNWDVTNWEFTDLNVYKSFKDRIGEDVEWQDTEFYKDILRAVESGRFHWGIQNKADLDNRCKYLDSLYESIRNNGLHLNRSICNKNSTYDEIDVNIGRNGEYLFQNGVHILSIAKILEIKYVPVMVFVRHKKWQEFREFVFSYAKQQRRGRLYQPIVHPDLADIPYYDLEGHNCEDIMKAIKLHLGPEKGVMLDIGANIGFFCHKFEDLGYQCYAVEKDPITFRILEKIKIAENKKFEVINKSIFEIELIKKMKFDVVLALNVFHHFLKTKTEFIKLKGLLKNLKMNQMFFEAHRYDDAQMKNAFINYTQPEFVDFVLQHTSLNKSEVIYTAKNGRTIFKLSK
jgi:2-polyprenyl-3-methyl-5-hydroxy-6-metoxy-1,4-benzoquinol methylase